MVISIGGISNAGKSRLAERIAAYYNGISSIVLCQDDYARPTPEIPRINGHTNWEIPDSIDFDRFYDALLESINHYELVIAEGLFIWYEDRLVKLFDKSVYITIDKLTFLERKRKDLRWGKEPEWYMKHIWENNRKYCHEIEQRARAFQIRGEEPVDFDSVIRYLESEKD